MGVKNGVVREFLSVTEWNLHVSGMYERNKKWAKVKMKLDVHEWIAAV